jgi:hypothetical protein
MADKKQDRPQTTQSQPRQGQAAPQQPQGRPYQKPARGGITMDQAVEYFQGLDDRQKITLFRRMGVVVFHHREQKSGEIFPSNAGVLGKAVPAMSRFMVAMERAYGNLVNRRVDIGNSALVEALAEKTYFRPLDEDGKPIGDQPGIVEQMMLLLDEQRNAIYEATKDAWVQTPFSTRRGRGARKPAQEPTEKAPQAQAAKNDAGDTSKKGPAKAKATKAAKASAEAEAAPEAADTSTPEAAAATAVA